MSNLNQVIREMTGMFDALGIHYVVMGGIAARAYGLPRPTYDLDFTASISRDRLPEVYHAVRNLGYSVSEPYLQGWVDSVGEMPLVKLRLFVEGNGIDVDVFLAESAFQESVVARRRQAIVDGNQVWLVSPEDLILLKLIAYRPRDIGDIGDVLFTQGQLDLTYLRDWAEQLGLLDRLELALRDIEGY